MLIFMRNIKQMMESYEVTDFKSILQYLYVEFDSIEMGVDDSQIIKEIELVKKLIKEKENE